MIGIQVRFLNDWKIEQKVLAFKHFPGSHNANAIRSMVEEQLISYGISINQVSGTSNYFIGFILTSFK